MNMEPTHEQVVFISLKQAIFYSCVQLRQLSESDLKHFKPYKSKNVLIWGPVCQITGKKGEKIYEITESGMILHML